MNAPVTAAPTSRLPRTRPAAPAQQPSQQLFDVIVLGSQLAGSLLGALLVKRGFRVLQIDHEGLGEFYEDRGYQLPYAPALVPSPKHLPQAESALAEIGSAVELYRALEASGDELQLILPRHRLDFPTDQDRRASEIDREFPRNKPALFASVQQLEALAHDTDPFFRENPPLPARGLLQRWALYRAKRRCPAVTNQEDVLAPIEQHQFGAALRGLAQFSTYLEDAEAGPLARARPVAHLLHGCFRFPWGHAGLRAVVQQRLRELGGTIVGAPHEPAVIEELVFEGSQLAGVKLAHARGVFRGRHVVAAMDVETLAPLIPPRFKKRGLSELFESVRARRILFPLNLVVRTAGLPLGLKNLALIVTEDEELGPVLLEVLPAMRPDGAVANERILSAAAFTSSAERDASEDEWRAFAKRLEAAVLSVAPFCEPHVVLRSAPLLDAKAARAHRLLAHPLLEMSGERALGIGGLPYRTGCKNLFLASREVVPGLGMEGEFIAATRAAALIQHALRKHDPLK